MVVLIFGLLIAEIWFDILEEGVFGKILMTAGLVIVLDIIVLAILRDVKQESDQTDKDLIQ
ncbi:MAG: hypothetical protein COB76_03030 [Alphaproteobacteria bacterium]|nr:MAG: hypothetical protein COB76_03030 [Alphaproteobacteria bacterium]